MKRIGLIGVSVGMVLLLTGCGQKSLDCSMEENNMKYNYMLNFDSKDLLKSGTFNLDIKLEDEQKEYLDEIVSEMEKQYDSSEFEGVDISVTDNGEDTVNVKMNFTSDEISAITGEELSDEDTYESIKKDLEDGGYVCK